MQGPLKQAKLHLGALLWHQQGPQRPTLGSHTGAKFPEKYPCVQQPRTFHGGPPCAE
jgi:hypothetical protein